MWNDYDWLEHDPEKMDSWHWFLQKGEWVREVKNAQEAETLAATRKAIKKQWVVTDEGNEYDAIQLEVKMPLEDGSILYGACGNPKGDLDKPIDFPSFLGMHAKVKEGKDSWLPLGIEVAFLLRGM